MASLRANRGGKGVTSVDQRAITFLSGQVLLPVFWKFWSGLGGKPSRKVGNTF